MGIIITQDQLIELDRIKTDEFILRAISHARENLIDKIRDTDEDLYIKFGIWLNDARKYDITKESDVLTYLELCLQNKDMASADKPKWMRMALNKKSMTGEKKLQRILDKIAEDSQPPVEL